MIVLRDTFSTKTSDSNVGFVTNDDATIQNKVQEEINAIIETYHKPIETQYRKLVILLIKFLNVDLLHLMSIQNLLRIEITQFRITLWRELTEKQCY